MEEGVTLEWFVDADLIDGTALSWRLRVVSEESEWVIESDVSRVEGQRSEIVVDLPTRHALDDDMGDELISAARMLVAVTEPVGR
jgi:hypothetical protein